MSKLKMKTTELPKTLSNLPFPWNIPDESRRRDYIRVSDIDRKTIETALTVLERSLKFLARSKFPEGESIPEEMTEYWNFTASSISRKIYSVDELNFAKIREVFKLNNVDSPSELMIEEAAQKWIWTIAYDLAVDSIGWLEEAMNDCKDPALVNRYLTIVSHYWQSLIPHRLVVSLIGTSNRIDRKKAIPLLEEVERTSQNPNLVRMARSYKQLTLKSNS